MFRISPHVTFLAVLSCLLVTPVLAQEPDRVAELENRLKKLETELEHYKGLAESGARAALELDELKESLENGEYDDDTRLVSHVEELLQQVPELQPTQATTHITFSGMFSSQLFAITQGLYTDPLDDRGSFLAFMRNHFNIDAQVDENTRVFFQFEDARFYGDDVISFFDDNDKLGIHQAYAEFSDVFGTGFKVTVGRQEIELFDGWFLSSGDGFRDNIGFDAIRVQGPLAENVQLEATYIAEVEAAFPSIGGFTDRDHDSYYFALTVDVCEGHKVGFAAFYRDRAGEQHYTLLAHAKGAFGAFDYLVNFAAQFDEIEAIAGRIELGYNFSIADMPTRLMIAWDFSSGDASTLAGGENKTFTPINQKNLYFHGAIGLSTGSNLQDAQMVLIMQPEPGSYLVVGGRGQWLWDRNDAWYGELLPINTYLPGTGEDFLGVELDVVYIRPLTPRIIFSVGASVFFPGDYVGRVADDDNTLLYVSSQIEVYF